MDYLFRLADGRRLALWNEKNQIIRQLSGGGGNRSQITLRTDFLSDLSAVSAAGRIYFVYQNTSRRVMLHKPDGDEDQELFRESIESCRHSGLTLVQWRGKLYLVYVAWSPVKEQYFLKLRALGEGVQVGGRELSDRSRLTERGTGEKEAGDSQRVSDGFTGELVIWDSSSELVLARDIQIPLEFQVMSDEQELRIMMQEQFWSIRTDESGRERVTEGRIIEKKELKRFLELEAEADRLRIELEEWGKRKKLFDQEILVWKEQYEAVLRSLEVKERERGEAAEKQEAERADRKKERANWEAERAGWEAERQRWQEKEMQWNAEKNAHHQDIQSAVTQYNELAEVARQLQKEGKKWRDKYIQEARKRKDRPVAAKGNGIIE